MATLVASNSQRLLIKVPAMFQLNYMCTVFTQLLVFLDDAKDS